MTVNSLESDAAPVPAPRRLDYRRATPNDIDELARLRWLHTVEDEPTTAEALADFSHRARPFFARAIANDLWHCWVAAATDRLVATLFVYAIHKPPRPSQPDAWFGYVTGVYTTPEARNQGVGGALLARVVTWARDRDCEFLILWPSERSVAFYERAGFARSAEALELHLPPT